MPAMRLTNRALGPCGLLLLVIAACGATAARAEVELEGLEGGDLAHPEHPAATGHDSQASAASATQQSDRPQPKAPVAQAPRSPPPPLINLPKQHVFVLEVSAAIVLALYTIVALIGTSYNEKIARAFCTAFCVGTDALFPKQFALCGAGDPTPGGGRTPLLKESSSSFKFYASGRRFCQVCMVSLTLKARPDLLSWVAQLFLPAEDLAEVEVYMNDASMPPMVLAVATPRQARALQSNRGDVRSFTKQLKTGGLGPADPVSTWNPRLHVLAEHSTYFHDLFSDPRLHSVLCAPQHADKAHLLRSIVISSDNSEGSHKRVLRVVVALPHHRDMKALAPLLGLVPLLIDLVATYRPNPDVKKRALESRAKREAAAADKEDARQKRIEMLQRRKLEKLAEEKEKLARMDPESRRKAEEKLAKQAAKKTMKTKVVRM